MNGNSEGQDSKRSFYKVVGGKAMLGHRNELISIAMDLSGSYPKGRTHCFDIGISGNCIGNCLLCTAFDNDFNSNLSELEKQNGNAMQQVQELIDMGLIDLESIREDYIAEKKLNT